MAEMLGDQFHQRLAHQARLARAGNARHRGEDAQRERDVEFVQVVARDAARAAAIPCGVARVRGADRVARRTDSARVCDASTASSPSGGPL